MAIVNIQVSQNVLDTGNKIDLITPADTNGSVGDVFDSLAQVSGAISGEFANPTSWNLSGNTLTFNFSDGSYLLYTGVVLSNPNATSGTATATGAQYIRSGALATTETGDYHFNYSLTNGNVLNLINTSATSSSAKIATTFYPYSSNYDANLGNVSYSFTGAVHIDGSQNLSGTVSSVTVTADKFLTSSTIQGNFQVSGAEANIGAGTAHASVSGNMTGYTANYYDGSHESITGISTYLSPTQVVDESILSDASRFSGDDNISIDLPAHLYKAFVMAAGSGNDQIAIRGGGGLFSVNAGDGNDLITVLSDRHQIDGGAGVDTVQYTGTRSQFFVEQGANGSVSVTDNAHLKGTDSLTNVERLQFSDTALAFDIHGNAGEAYRVYQAAFNRTPDAGGLGYWIAALDKGASLSDVANGFISSAEFKALYGSSPTNAAFVAGLYDHVLHRTPDQGGNDYWNGLLTHGTSRADVLASFSESPENQAQVIGSIQNGISYTHFG